MVWDRGAYDTKEGVPANRQLAQGRLEVELHGVRLCGGFTLIRSKKRSADPTGKEQRLLIKHRDECADPALGCGKVGALIARCSRAGA
jgi:bifunctional non-homologous end joining protein LigD